RGFPPQAQVESEPMIEAVIILQVQTEESVAIVLEFSCALSEGQIAAVIGQRTGQEIRDAAKAELCRLKELIVEINLAAFNDATEFHIVLAADPAYVISPGHIIADETCLRIIAEIE